MDDKLSKIVNNLQKEGVDDSAINDVVQKVKEYWSYIGNIDWNTIDYCNTLKVINCAKFLKAKFNDETKFAIMNKTLVFRDEEICIFKPTNFNESRIIGEPICCFAYSQERWNEHYEFDQEAIYYVYDVMRYGTDEDFVAITVRPNGSALVLDKKHNWWSRHDSTRFIQGLGGGAAVITTKEGKAIKSENKECNIYKHMNKRTIRLTESDLHRIVKESVNKILKEEYSTPPLKDRTSFANYANVDYYNGGIDDKEDFDSVAGILNQVYTHLIDIQELLPNDTNFELIGDSQNGSEKYFKYLTKCINRAQKCVSRIVNINQMNRGLQPRVFDPKNSKPRYKSVDIYNPENPQMS